MFNCTIDRSEKVAYSKICTILLIIKLQLYCLEFCPGFNCAGMSCINCLSRGEFYQEAIVSLVCHLIFSLVSENMLKKRKQFTKLEINLQLFYRELDIWPQTRDMQFDREADFRQRWSFCNQSLGKSASILLSYKHWKIIGSSIQRISEGLSRSSFETLDTKTTTYFHS